MCVQIHVQCGLVHVFLCVLLSLQLRNLHAMLATLHAFATLHACYFT